MPTDNDEKPKKSWRERDKGRDRSRHTSTSSDWDRERFEKTTAYTSYKQKLERVFGGGELSEALRDQLDPKGEGKEKDKKLKAIREAEGAEAFARAIDDLLKTHGFPDDAYLLDRALEHPRKEVQLRALADLTRMKSEGKLQKPPASLKLRLDGLILDSDDGDVRDGAKTLKAKL